MSTEPAEIVVVGSLNCDYTIRAPRLPSPGETVVGDALAIGPGGKGGNQAVAAARLGARVAMVGSVGSDPGGEMLRASLRAAGVDDSGVAAAAGSQTGSALILVNAEGEKAIAAFPGANGLLQPAAAAAAKSALRRARVVMLQLEIPITSVLEAAFLANSGGAAVFLDPAPVVEVPETLWPLVTLVRPNPHEAEALTGIAVTSIDSAREAAGWFLRQGVEKVCLSAAGMDLLFTANWEEIQPWWPIRATDATGAGDAFCGAMAWCHVQGKTDKESLRFASAAAALSTTRPGAQASMPTRAEVEEFIAGQG